MNNYFELYQLPVTFRPDAAAVRAKFYELSKTYHPDRFVQADEHARAESLRMAAMNNDAYKVLTDHDKTMAYIFRLNGILEEEEKYNLPPDFLMEMMDLNEAVSEYEREPENKEMQEQATMALDTQLEQWDREVEQLIAQAEKSNMSKDVLLQIKDYYFRKKYLLRIQERIDTFAAR
jgi:molecular chaperone HscB